MTLWYAQFEACKMPAHLISWTAKRAKSQLELLMKRLKAFCPRLKLI